MRPDQWEIQSNKRVDNDSLKVNDNQPRYWSERQAVSPLWSN